MGPLGSEGTYCRQPALELPHGGTASRGPWRLLPGVCAFFSTTSPPPKPRRVGAASGETTRSPTQKIYSSGAPYKVANGFNEA